MWIKGPADWYAGASPVRQAVTIELGVEGIVIRDHEDAERDRWPFGELVVGRGDGPLVLIRTGAEGRLVVSDPETRGAFAAATRALPRQGESRVPKAFLVAVAGIAGVIAVLVVLALKGVSALAGTLAPLVPDAAVAELDRASLPGVLGSLGTGEGERCGGAAGVAALGRLTLRLATAGGVRPMDWTVGVWRSPVPNALALPGGTIVVTHALLDHAESADAFAGVLAHEIGHVHHRHGLKALLHNGGLSLVASVLTGDAGGLVTAGGRVLVGASYSRDAEREADAFAVTTVAAAGGDATAFGPFLATIGGAGEDGGPAGLLASHPLTAEREAAVVALGRAAPRGPGPLMPNEDWAAIRAICG